MPVSDIGYINREQVTISLCKYCLLTTEHWTELWIYHVTCDPELFPANLNENKWRTVQQLVFFLCSNIHNKHKWEQKRIPLYINILTNKQKSSLHHTSIKKYILAHHGYKKDHDHALINVPWSPSLFSVHVKFHKLHRDKDNIPRVTGYHIAATSLKRKEHLAWTRKERDHYLWQHQHGMDRCRCPLSATLYTLFESKSPEKTGQSNMTRAERENESMWGNESSVSRSTLPKYHRPLKFSCISIGFYGIKWQDINKGSTWRT
jgi:hypothetical protein